MPADVGRSREQDLAVAIEQTPGDPEPRLVLARLLVARGQYAAAKGALAGVTLAPESEALRAAIARGLGGQPLGKPTPPRARGIGWLSVSWRLVVVVVVAGFVGAAPAWAPEIERRWRVGRIKSQLANPRTTTPAKVQACADLVRLAFSDEEQRDASERVAEALVPSELSEEDALRALEMLSQLPALSRITRIKVLALGHASARVRHEAALEIVRVEDDADLACRESPREIEAAVAKDDDVAVVLMPALARSSEKSLREAVLLAAGARDRPQVRIVALQQLARRLAHAYDPRAAQILRAAFERDRSLFSSLGPAASWLVLPADLNAYLSLMKDRAADTRSSRHPQPKVLARGLSLFTVGELEAAEDRYPDGTVRSVLFEAKAMIEGTGRP